MRERQCDPRAEQRLELTNMVEHGDACPACGSEQITNGVCPDPTRPMDVADFGCTNCEFFWDAAQNPGQVFQRARRHRQRNDVVPVNAPDHMENDQ